MNESNLSNGGLKSSSFASEGEWDVSVFDSTKSNSTALKQVQTGGIWKSISDTAGFGRNPEEFLSKRFEEKGEVFGARILQWPVVFAASHAAVKEVLECKDASSRSGYASFPGLGLFGDAVLFQDGEEHQRLRESLKKSVFADEKLLETSDIAMGVRNRAKQVVAELIKEDMVLEVYEFTKQACADMLRMAFLKSESIEEHETIEKFKQLQSNFWKGTVSSGLNVEVKLGVFKKKSAFSEAQDARETLIEMFSAVDDEFDACPSKCPFGRLLHKQDRLNHMLMFTSSMVVKSVASIVTSFVMLLSAPENQLIRSRLVSELHSDAPETKYLEKVIFEVERLIPPVIGNCRATKRPVVVRGHEIPKNTRLWCSILTANRDPAVFKEPQKFDPSRWDDTNALGHFSFGASLHGCLGRPFARLITSSICREILLAFPSWSISSNSRGFRWLPVARPVDGLPTKFYRKRH